MRFHFVRTAKKSGECRKPKIFVLKRRCLTMGAAVLAAAGVFAVVNYPAAVSASAATRQLPIYCVQRTQKMCAISFDAAWGADNTQMILDVLGDYGVKSTFFVVGNWADQYPEQAKAIAASGCELMNHSNAHDHFNSLTADEIIADVNTCSDKIDALSGVRPTLIRPCDLRHPLDRHVADPVGCGAIPYSPTPCSARLSHDTHLETQNGGFTRQG